MRNLIVDNLFKTASASRWPTWVGKKCVEVKRTHDCVYVKDSKNPTGAVLEFTLEEWEAFIIGVKNDEFNISIRKN